ncbi:ROK family protein [Actinocorallia sp. A-T 12471]|uniref:ROK family protein n=1 Tax=Actinocorallia sp. A-T 12471 TaxID=3089813 RepID=UPI0029CDF7C8|nr:ROK family protein [Actinocorallia sp. A-T 12471]MDX6740795.1 ROK family protein [Actinocorallia sp. A-T 12471]
MNAYPALVRDTGDLQEGHGPMTALAIDIGGTKFAAALAEPDGTLGEPCELPVGDDPTATLHALLDRIASEPVKAVGIGSAGPLDPLAGTVSPVNIPAWRGFPLVAEVARRFPGRPVRLAGDAQCMALGEWWRGGTGHDDLLGIVVSTGVGGGLVLGGRPYFGAAGNAGFLGHIVVDPSGDPCPCGQTGCLETVASGPSMVRRALAKGWTPTTPHPDARALAESARAGSPQALAAFTEAATALATVITTTATLLDLSHTVIGGGLAAASDLLLPPLRAALPARLTVSPTTLHRTAGLHGAAALTFT